MQVVEPRREQAAEVVERRLEQAAEEARNRPASTGLLRMSWPVSGLGPRAGGLPFVDSVL